MSDETQATEQEPQAGGTPPADEQQQEPQEDQQPLTFDGWIDEQPEDVQMLVEQHTSGLKSALSDERSERKKLQTQLKQLSAQAEEGSELRTQLDELNATLEAQTVKANFYESAPADVDDMRLAYLAAKEGGHISKNGSVDWDSIRSDHPGLFKRAVTPVSNAGSGTQQRTNHQPPTMNDFLRVSAGFN